MQGMYVITYLQACNAYGKTYEERKELLNFFWANSMLDPDYVDVGVLPLDSARSFVGRIHESLDTLATSLAEDPRIHVVYSHEFPISTALNMG